jgi:hypothetical protein
VLLVKAESPPKNHRSTSCADETMDGGLVSFRRIVVQKRGAMPFFPRCEVPNCSCHGHDIVLLSCIVFTSFCQTSNEHLGWMQEGANQVDTAKGQ